jgi:hypothetical protein
MSLQYYGSPFISAGQYTLFRRVSEASSRHRDERYEDLDVTFDPVTRMYIYSRDAESYQFRDPDFSFLQFRSNLVYRWEYRPGSTLFLVWAHDRSDYSTGFLPTSEITQDPIGLTGNHVLMVKLNIWFAI